MKRISDYGFKLAIAPVEVKDYFALRHDIFVEEQEVFTGHEVDDWDALAYPIIAQCQQQVVGVVRIYESEPRLWYGGRLGVHQDHRRAGQVGKGLINQAVTTANAWGCARFLATVQQQNVRFFQRLHWAPLEEISLFGLPHYLMEADLDFYPANHEPRPECLPLLQTAS
jgi:putative N-acetyltransferase (TIGR04045 family)